MVSLSSFPAGRHRAKHSVVIENRMWTLSILLCIFLICATNVQCLERIQHCHAYGVKSYNLLAFSKSFEFSEFERYLRKFAEQAYQRTDKCPCPLSADGDNCDPPQRHITYAGSIKKSVSCDGEMIDCVNQLLAINDPNKNEYYLASKTSNDYADNIDAYDQLQVYETLAQIYKQIETENGRLPTAYMKTNVVLFTNYIEASLRNESKLSDLIVQNDQQNTVMFVVYDRSEHDMRELYTIGHKYKWNQINIAVDTIQPLKSATQLTKPSDARFRKVSQFKRFAQSSTVIQLYFAIFDLMHIFDDPKPIFDFLEDISKTIVSSDNCSPTTDDETILNDYLRIKVAREYKDPMIDLDVDTEYASVSLPYLGNFTRSSIFTCVSCQPIADNFLYQSTASFMQHPPAYAYCDAFFDDLLANLAETGTNRTKRTLLITTLIPKCLIDAFSRKRSNRLPDTMHLDIVYVNPTLFGSTHAKVHDAFSGMFQKSSKLQSHLYFIPIEKLAIPAMRQNYVNRLAFCADTVLSNRLHLAAVNLSNDEATPTEMILDVDSTTTAIFDNSTDYDDGNSTDYDYGFIDDAELERVLQEVQLLRMIFFITLAIGLLANGVLLAHNLLRSNEKYKEFWAKCGYELKEPPEEPEEEEETVKVEEAPLITEKDMTSFEMLVKSAWHIDKKRIKIDQTAEIAGNTKVVIFKGHIKGKAPVLDIFKTVNRPMAMHDCDCVVKIERQSPSGNHSTGEHSASDELLTEIRILNRLGFHRHIVTILGVVFVKSGHRFGYAIELLDQSLGALIATVKTDLVNSAKCSSRADRVFPPIGAMLSISQQICDTMNFITHTNKILHRNLTIKSVLLTGGKKVKISGFQLAKQLVDEETEITIESHPDDFPSHRCLAPEITVEKRFTRKSDVWSFGIIAHEMLSISSTALAGRQATLAHEDINAETIQIESYPNVKIYNLIKSCLNPYEKERPPFSYVHQEIGKMLFDTSVLYGYVDVVDEDKYQPS